MNASQRAKDLGAKNLKVVAEAINKHPTTLNNWYRDNPDLFDAVLVGYVAITNDWRRELSN